MYLKNPKVGAISVTQRFGGALNLNVHFHTLFMDGVYYQNDQGEQVFREIIPTDQDIAKLVKKAKKRIDRAFYNRGFLDSLLIEETPLSSSIDEDYQLSLIKSESIQNRVDEYQRPKSIGKRGDSPFEELSGEKFAYKDGFSLHAKVKILGHQRSALERLCSYVARGAIAENRLTLTDEGAVRLELKRAYSDGTTHLEFTPRQFIKRLIALIPPPRQNFIRYYGVFGARHRNRKEITSMAPGPAIEKSKKVVYRTPWAHLLKRVFKYDVLHCDYCGNRLTLIASITSPVVCAKILNHLKIDLQEFEVISARGPPMGDDCALFEDSFDQESYW